MMNTNELSDAQSDNFEPDEFEEIQREKRNLNMFGLDWTKKDLFNLDWAIFSEEQLHKIISHFYESMGFEVLNLHASDRANEGGADLVAKKKNLSIAIAVKIKPKKKDYAQALELSERRESEKNYYFVNTPTNDFLKKIERLTNVNFKPMNDFLALCYQKNPQLYFQLIISNKTKLDYYMNQSKFFLLSMWNLKDSKVMRKTPLSKESLQELWRMKDIAVELNKTTGNFLTFYENRKFTDKELETQTFLSILRQFEITLSVLPLILKNFYEKNQAFLARNAAANYLDSDWLSYGLAERLTPEGLESYLTNYETSKADLEKLTITAEIRSYDLNEIFCDILSYIYSFGHAFEYRIDNFFNQAIGLPFERDKR